MAPEEIEKRFGPKCEIAVEDEEEGMNVYCPSVWLEGEDNEEKAFSDCGHVFLDRNFRGLNDPAVLISKTMLAGPEMLEILKAMVKNTEDGLVALGWASIEQYRGACRKNSGDMDPYIKAVELIEKLEG